MDCVCNETSSLEVFQAIGSIIIALFDVGVASYFIFYQMGKDRSDRKIFAENVNNNTRLEFFKILILEPNIGYVYNFFEEIYTKIKYIPQQEVTLDSKRGLVSELDYLFNQFEQKFLALLNSVNSPLYEKQFTIIDVLRDDLSRKIEILQNSDPENLNELKDLMFKIRKEFLFELYNFNPK